MCIRDRLCLGTVSSLTLPRLPEQDTLPVSSALPCCPAAVRLLNSTLPHAIVCKIKDALFPTRFSGPRKPWAKPRRSERVALRSPHPANTCRGVQHTADPRWSSSEQCHNSVLMANTFEFWRLAQMALKNLTNLTRLQLEKDPDRLGIYRVL